MWVRDNHYDYISKSANSTPTFMSLLQKAGYTTLMAGKDHLSAKSGVGQTGSVMASELGFDLFRRCLDKYETCATAMGSLKQAHMPDEQYGVSLLNFNVWEKQCAAYGPYGTGFGCNSTQVCDAPPPTLECGFRCPVLNPVDNGMNIDQWAERQAEELLTGHWALNGKEQPWFLQLGFPSPHPPFILTAAEHARTANKNFPPPVDAHFENVTNNGLRFNVDLLQSQREYAALLEMLDDQLERFVTFLKQNGVYEDTVIIITSDHGEHLGDHTAYGKSSAWEEANHVPLVVTGPGIRRQTLDRPVATLDMVATMLELANEKPLPEMDSVSLLPVLGGGLPQPRVILSGLDGAKGFDGRGGGFESAAKLFNETAFFRVVCCLSGCIKQGSMLPITAGPQVALMHVTPGTGVSKNEENILNKPKGRGLLEAEELLQHLSPNYRLACLPLLNSADLDRQLVYP